VVKDKAIKDLSEDLEGKLTSTEKKLEKMIAGKDEMGAPPRTLPVPNKLTVWDGILFGFAYVDALQRWKYVGKITGYEFYGSHNSGFTPQANPYSQSGHHYGSNSSTYLYTYESSTSSNNFIFDKPFELVGLTLENVTQGTSGSITLLSLVHLAEAYYKLTVSGVTWDKGDRWRIKRYPSNRLWNVDAVTLFTKYMDCSYYVKARTVGIGKSFSQFTDEVSSTEQTALPDPADWANVVFLL
jgi:hypothetical protein